MRDTNGQSGTLTITMPVRRDRADHLSRTLQLLQPGLGVFLACPHLHFARLVVLDGLADQPPRYVPGPMDQPRLLFTVSFDGPRSFFVEELRRAVFESAPGSSGRLLDEAWHCCDGYPGAGSAGAFASYFRGQQVRNIEFIAGYGNATVAEVREALQLQGALREFAAAVQGTSPDELLSAFKARFP